MPGMASERRGHARGASLALRRLGALALITLALWFAIEGGEFGTMDLLRQRQQEARIAKTIDSLQRVVDSLKRYENSVDHDPATQERIAREVFGMVRGDTELLYRFADSPKRATP
jgi:cell division protein FtsB